MNPFLLLGIPMDADDEMVAGRYRELVNRYPPEAAPDEFAAIRKAFDQVSTVRKRVMQRLFYFDVAGLLFSEDSRCWPEAHERRRLGQEELERFMRESRWEAPGRKKK